MHRAEDSAAYHDRRTPTREFSFPSYNVAPWFLCSACRPRLYQHPSSTVSLPSQRNLPRNSRQMGTSLGRLFFTAVGHKNLVGIAVNLPGFLNWRGSKTPSCNKNVLIVGASAGVGSTVGSGPIPLSSTDLVASDPPLDCPADPWQV